jgi:hypothetical protein
MDKYLGTYSLLKLNQEHINNLNRLLQLINEIEAVTVTQDQVDLLLNSTWPLNKINAPQMIPSDRKGRKVSKLILWSSITLILNWIMMQKQEKKEERKGGKKNWKENHKQISLMNIDAWIFNEDKIQQ